MRFMVLFVVTLTVFAQNQKPSEESLEEKRVQLRAKEIKARKEAEKAQKELRKLDSQEMKQARKELKREEEIKNIWARVETQSRLSGCKPNTVFLDPVITGGKFASPYNMVRITVVNASAIPINVRMSDVRRSGEVIKQLCPGGKVDIVRKMDALDPNWVQGNLTAYPSDSEVPVWTENWYYSLGWNYADTRTWVVRH